jgi:hypothetical protein
VTSAAERFAARYGTTLSLDWKPAPDPEDAESSAVVPDGRPPIPPGIPPKPGPAPNAFMQQWYFDLAAEAVRLLGEADSETWLNNPTLTGDHAPIAFPDIPDAGELAAIRYELDFAARRRASQVVGKPRE